MSPKHSSPADIARILAGSIGTNDDESTVSQFLDTGYAELNFALSSRFDGGFAVKRITEIAGPPSAGKTAIATAAMASAQAMGGIAGFADHERSFSLMLAPRLGLNPDPSKFIFKKPRTFEESVQLLANAAHAIRSNQLIPDEAPIAWVWDSLASMVPQSALLDKNGKPRSAEDRNMNDNTALARATSAHFPALAQICEENNICLIILNQIRTKLGVMYGDPRTTPGGESPKFYASTRLMLGSKHIKNAKTNEIIGAEVTANVIKNKVSRPFLDATWRFVFNEDGTGRFDVERSTIDFLERIDAFPKCSRNGYVIWNGVQVHKDTLAKKVREEGLMADLKKLLPGNYEPEVIAAGELLLDGSESAEDAA